VDDVTLEKTGSALGKIPFDQDEIGRLRPVSFDRLERSPEF
jgi:hypothetical protein